MDRVLVKCNYNVRGKEFNCELTKKQLKKAIEKGGTYINSDGKLYWCSDNTPVSRKDLPSNIYAYSRVVLKRNNVIVYMPYISEDGITKGEHIVLFDKRTLKIIDERIGQNYDTPYVVVDDNNIVRILSKTNHYENRWLINKNKCGSRIESMFEHVITNAI